MEALRVAVWLVFLQGKLPSGTSGMVVVCAPVSNVVRMWQLAATPKEKGRPKRPFSFRPHVPAMSYAMGTHTLHQPSFATR